MKTPLLPARPCLVALVAVTVLAACSTGRTARETPIPDPALPAAGPDEPGPTDGIAGNSQAGVGPQKPPASAVTPPAEPPSAGELVAGEADLSDAEQELRELDADLSATDGDLQGTEQDPAG